MEEVQRLIIGVTALGTGGGGNPNEGLKMLNEVINSGKSIRLIDVKELSKDTITVVPYFVGSIAPDARTRKPIKIIDPIKRAFDEMERYLGKKIGAVVASELGGANTPVALSIAAKLDIPAIDGDLLGRAAPELHQCTVHIFDIPMYPAVIVTETGNIVVIKEYSDIDDYESIARYMSILGGRFSAVVDTPMNLDHAMKAIIPGTISLSLKIGDEVLKARKEGNDPVQAVVNTLNGWMIFKGIVEKYVWRNEGGFLKGEVLIKGVEKFKDKKLKSWIMNEHIMVWFDEKPIIMPPDLLILLNDEGDPITNTELKEGMRVNAVAAKAPQIWRTPKGLKYFGPKHFGFEYDYIPVEELVKGVEI